MNNGVQTTSGTTGFTTEHRPLGVVVGYDASEQGTLALHYGARAAQRRDIPLTVVTAFTIAPAVYTTLAAVPDVPEEQVKREATEKVLDQAREYLADYPGEVHYRPAEGDAAGVLVKLSSSAQLVVVGARGRGGFLGRLLGSVSSALPAHAECPTVVVPRSYAAVAGEGTQRFAPSDRTEPVVVGIDGSPQSRVAVLQAAEAAAERDVPLRLILVLPPLDSALMWYPDMAPRGAEDTDRRAAELHEALEAERRWVQAHYPDLEITAHVEPGDPVDVLREISADAQLTVVGTRGRGGVASALLGSVSRAVLAQAAGPVMVVPPLEDERLADQPEFTR